MALPGLESCRRAAGFTLVELLLAITLMSMLLALAYGGLRASARATDRGQVILEESGRIRMAHQFVRKQLNQMVMWKSHFGNAKTCPLISPWRQTSRSALRKRWAASP